MLKTSVCILLSDSQLEDMETTHCLVRSNEVSKDAHVEEFSRTVTPKTDGAVTFLAPGVSLPVGTGFFILTCEEETSKHLCRKAWKAKTNRSEEGGVHRTIEQIQEQSWYPCHRVRSCGAN